ncbi:MAG: carboxypeptidase regulatory-like domain-containing protein [Oceanicaulis sp.]
MAIFKKLSYGASLAALLAAAPAAAVHAQETTGAISGQIVSESGAPVSGASVTVIHTPTGSVSTTVTGAEGSFSARNLRVGGPYTVTVSADGFGPARAEDLMVRLGQTNTITLSLEAGAATTDVIVVTGQAVRRMDTAVGPNAVFSQEVLEEAPAINRTLNDVIRIDPRIYVDEADVDGIQCAGANSRFNSLTVDGVRLNDSFGLNRNGFPTERQPFSYDAIEQVAVELAPFDVYYGGFSACNINAVTKSGANEFSGGLFYDYTSDDLRGDSREGSPVQLAEFEEERWGFNVGGPIIKDNLFFFVAYEYQEGANTFDRGPEGSGVLNEVAGFTQAQFDEIRDIAINQYNYDPGGLPTSFPNEDEKLLVKLDWEINNQHRANFTYTYNDGFNITQSDGDADEFEYSNHLYERGAELNSYVGSLFSNWTDNFSTELRLGYTKLDNRQNSVGQDGFGEFRIDVGPNTIYIGEDDSRQANELNYDVLTLIARGTYDWNNHSFSFGFERETTDVFNLFVQHAIGQFDFDSIDDFRNGTPSGIDYENAPSLDPADAAAEFAFSVNSFYAQDVWDVTDTVTVTAGLRYDLYTSDDEPALNQNFVDSYGFENTATLDGLGLLQPRLGVQWEATDRLSVRGGVGLFSGGNPNVWLSNSYSNDFVRKFGADEDAFYDAGFTSLFDAGVVYPDGQGPGYSVPSQLIDSVAGAESISGFEMNYLDPDFDIPGEWKAALGATYLLDVPAPVLGGEYVLNADLLYTRDHNAATVIRGDFVEATPAVGGLIPQYDSPFSPNSLVLTNTDLEAEAVSLSFSVSKEYDFGLDWLFGYAYNDAEDVNPMTSSVAFSNYTSPAFADPQNPGIATSNYNIENRFTLLVNYETDWLVEDYFTKVSLFGLASEGRPFSYTMNSRGGGDITNFNPFLRGDNFLLYVPTGVSDPNVDLSGLSDVNAFFDFLDREGLSKYAGGFAPRNGFEGGWWTKVDLRFEQELPGLMAGHRTNAFVVIDNFTNMLNDEWGILREASFPRRVSVVDAELVNGDTQLAYTGFRDGVKTPVVGDASLWQVRVGVRYEF